MANEELKIWGIHTKDDNLFLKDDIIAIGWHEIGDLKKIDANRDAFKEKYRNKLIRLVNHIKHCLKLY